MQRAGAARRLTGHEARAEHGSGAASAERDGNDRHGQSVHERGRGAVVRIPERMRSCRHEPRSPAVRGQARGSGARGIGLRGTGSRSQLLRRGP